MYISRSYYGDTEAITELLMLLLLLVIYFVSYFVTAPAAALAAPAFVGHAHSPLPVTPPRLTPQPGKGCSPAEGLVPRQKG